MTLHTLRCNHLTPLHFKRLTISILYHVVMYYILSVDCQNVCYRTFRKLRRSISICVFRGDRRAMPWCWNVLWRWFHRSANSPLGHLRRPISFPCTVVSYTIYILTYYYQPGPFSVFLPREHMRAVSYTHLTLPTNREV